MSIAEKVFRALDGMGVPYEQIDIDPANADTARFCEVYGYPIERSANTIIVGSKKEPKQYAACVVRADTRLDVNHAVRALMGVSRLMALDWLIVGGGDRATKVKIAPEVFRRLPNARVVADLAG